MKLIDYLFPRQCIDCSNIGAYLCKKCKKKLEPHPEICPSCHRISKEYQVCLDCRSEKKFFLEGIIIPFAYTDLLKKFIIKLKYFHKKDIGNFLVDRLIITLQAHKIFQKEFHQSEFGILNSELIISFIPSHRYRKYFVKGYNQSEVLAKRLSERLQLPMITIAKKKHTKSQASLDRNGRLYNLKNAFSLSEGLELKGNETLLIVDDITTTGSTINELAKLVRHKYPMVKIRGIVLGRHIG